MNVDLKHNGETVINLGIIKIGFPARLLKLEPVFALFLALIFPAAAFAAEITVTPSSRTVLTRFKPVGVNFEMILTSDTMSRANGRWIHETFKGSKLGMVRWGYEAWNWDWENEVSLNRNIAYSGNNSKDAAGSFGLYEFVAMCKETGNTPLMMVPVSDVMISSLGWPLILEKAKRMAEYVKSQGITNAYFELGNEPGYTSGPEAGVPIATYMSRAKELYTAIKSVSPQFKTVLSMHTYNYTTVISGMAGMFDALDYHSYSAMGSYWTTYYGKADDNFYSGGSLTAGKELILGECNILWPGWTGVMSFDLQTSLILANSFFGTANADKYDHIVTWPSHWPGPSLNDASNDYGFFNYDDWTKNTNASLFDGVILAHRLANENILGSKVAVTSSDAKLRAFAYSDSAASKLNVIVINKYSTPQAVNLNVSTGYNRVNAFSLTGTSLSDKHPVYTAKLPALTEVIGGVLQDTVPPTSLCVYQFENDISVSAPGPFSLLSPAAGGTKTSIFKTFSWGPSSGALNYRLVVSTNSDLSSPAVSEDVGNKTEHQVLTGKLLLNTLYYWKVIASNKSGSTAAVNSGNTFRTAASFTDLTLDTAAPSGGIAINGGAASTGSVNVTLDLSAQDAESGVSQMRFSNNNTSWSSAETFSVKKTWALTNGDGLKTVYVKYMDTAGNWSGVYSDTITLGSSSDTTPPQGSISINGGAEYTNGVSVTLSLSATDTQGTIVSMKFSVDGVTYGLAEVYGTTKVTALASGDGVKNIYVRYCDNADNWSTASITDSIILDTAAPFGSLSINGGGAYTKTTLVTLSLSGTDTGSGVVSMKAGNTSGAGTTEAYVTSKAWTLLSGDGVKTVYVRYLDGAGNWSADKTDTIGLDALGPTGSISVNGGALTTSSTAVTLVFSAADAGSSVVSMRIGNSSGSGAPEVYTSGKSWNLSAGDGTKTVYVSFLDNSGNWGSEYSDTIYLSTGALDTTPPSGSVSINGGAANASSTTITLSLSAADTQGTVSSMRFSLDGINFGAAEVYTASKVTVLSAGDGIRSMHVKYCDNSGNWMAGSVSDSILIDTVPPAGSVSVNSGAEYTKTSLVTLSLSGSDTGSGLVSMKVGNASGAGAAEVYAASKAWTLSSGDGVKTVYVRFLDAAGNWSGDKTDTINLDSTGPAGSISINGGALTTASSTVTLSLSAVDAGGSIISMKLSNSPGAGSVETYASAKTWALSSGEGTKTVYASFLDSNGNWGTECSGTIIFSQPPVFAAQGDGLNATYFNNEDLTGATATRVDPVINFNWGEGVPAAGMKADRWSARWAGLVQPARSENYTFYIYADDGARLWVDGRLIIDRWGMEGAAEWSGSISLQAGQKYNILLEYCESKKNAVVELRWSSNSTPKQVIPKESLYSIGDGLLATYYDNRDLTGSRSVKLEKSLDFNWGSGSPVAGIGAETWSARWTGKLMIRTSGTYKFYLSADDGARLFLDGRLLLDAWDGQKGVELSAAASFSEGLHDIKLEYYDDSASAFMKLMWEGPSLAKELIPLSCLYSSHGLTAVGLSSVLGSIAPDNLNAMSVYPNPYSPAAAVDGNLKIINLPSGTTVFIYNTAGELVRRLETLDFGDIGFVAWNGKNGSNEDVGKGMYICLAKAADNSRKTLVINLVR